LITSKGYPCIEYSTVTADGFILAMQNIPHGRNNKKSAAKPVVLLVHGLEDSSATWVMNSEQESLAFILADAGMDVWLGNNRGNTYSTTNTKYNASQAEFWDWSFDELAAYDAPAMINFVVSQTGAEKITWVGHSRGTHQLFLGLSLPQNAYLANKLNLFVALAPIAYVGDVSNPLFKALAPFDSDDILEMFGIYEFFPTGGILTKYLPFLCALNPMICDDMLYLIMGCCDTQNINQTRLDVYWNHFPAGTSTKEIAHYCQALSNDNVAMYDYGAEGNMQHYNQSTPPQYNLAQIPASIPIAFFSGTLDALADPLDVSILAKDLPTPPVLWNIQNPYTHMDFVWGLDAHQVIYPSVISLINNYTRTD